LIILDFFCKKCGNQENEVLVKDHREEVICKICQEKMERIYSGTVYKTRRKSDTPYPTNLLGRGNDRANFGIM
jgi:hypothetical protein